MRAARKHWTEEDLEAAKQRMGKGGGVEHVVAREAHNLKVAGSTPAPATKYRSKWELLFATKCELEQRAGLILRWWYEPASLRLEDPMPGKKRKRHTPDFWLWLPDRTLKIVAVKGYHKNIRESLTLIRWAAQRYPFAEWWVTWLRDGAWEEEWVGQCIPTSR